jgi:hypothetical protein
MKIEYTCEGRIMKQKFGEEFISLKASECYIILGLLNSELVLDEKMKPLNYLGH